MELMAIDKPAEIKLDDAGTIVLLARRNVTKPRVREWAYRHARLRAEDSARLRELRATFTIEDWPELHFEPTDEDRRSRFRTQQYIDGLYDLLREIVRETAVELRGVDVELDAAKYRDPETIVAVLEHVGLLEHAGLLVSAAQGPERREAFCSGS